MGLGFSSKASFFPILYLLSFTILTLHVPVYESTSDYTTFVYKGCAKQGYSDPLFFQALASLFASLKSQSSKTKFFKTTSGDGQTSISGLFQCRGDLSNGDCYKCVSRLPEMADQLCGKTVAARVQLTGCYIMYQDSGFGDMSGMQMLFKTCGATNVAGAGFEERRDTAFGVMENGVVSKHGFYTTNYESVYMLAQCQGDLGDSDCGDCVKNAVQKAQVECGSSISGQVYLHRCFFSYSYSPNGIPKKSSPSSDSSSGYSSPSDSWSSETGQNTGKTVAIILGGVAGVGFVVICLLFARNVMKKHDDY